MRHEKQNIDIFFQTLEKFQVPISKLSHFYVSSCKNLNLNLFILANERTSAGQMNSSADASSDTPSEICMTGLYMPKVTVVSTTTLSKAPAKDGTIEKTNDGDLSQFIVITGDESTKEVVDQIIQ
jgi:hypothetical protein